MPRGADALIPRSVRLAMLTIVGLTALALPREASACATCGAADPTLTALGVEQPFEGRFRLSGTLSHSSYAIGRPDLDRVEVADQRAELGLSYAPLDWLTFSVLAPLVWREVAYANLAHDRTLGLGDTNIGARAVFFRDRPVAPEHLLSATVGLDLPTTIPLRGPDGLLLPVDAQPGRGAFAPSLGVGWSYFGGLFSSHLWFVGRRDFEGIGGLANGFSGLVRYTAQLQPLSELAFLLGADLRFNEHPAIAGTHLQEGGGVLLFLSPGIVVAPITDLLLRAQARIPLVGWLAGGHWEGPTFELAVIGDL